MNKLLSWLFSDLSLEARPVMCSRLHAEDTRIPKQIFKRHQITTTTIKAYNLQPRRRPYSNNQSTGQLIITPQY